MMFQKVFLAASVSCLFLVFEHYVCNGILEAEAFTTRTVLKRIAGGNCIDWNHETLCKSSTLVRRLVIPSFSLISSDEGTLKPDVATKNVSEDGDTSVSLTPLYEVTDKLHQILNQEISNQVVVTVGYITHKRTFGSALAFIDLVESNHDPEVYTYDPNPDGGDSDPLSPPSPLQALLKRQAYNHDESKSAFSSILKSIHPGTKVYLEGYASPTKNVGEVVLLVSRLKFLKSSRNPEHVKGMLQRFDLDDGDDDDDGSDGPIDTEVMKAKTGLALDEFDAGVFGPQVSSKKLRQVLLGAIDAEDLFQIDRKGGGTSNAPLSSGDTNSIEGGKRTKMMKVPFAKIARLIVDHLPIDKDYPAIILSMKGRDRRSLEKSGRQNNILPPAPSYIKSVPPIISDARKIYLENGNDATQESTTSEILAGFMQSGRDRGEFHPQHIKHTTISGWVQNRRRFQSDSVHSIAVLELVDDLASANNGGSDEPDRLKCILHPEFMSNEGCSSEGQERGDDMLSSDVYGHLASKGSRVALQGFCIYNNNDDGPQRPFFWVTEAHLQRSSWRPAIIRFFLDLISGTSDEIGKYSFDIQEIGDALDMGHSDASQLVEECQSTGTTERQWRAAELSKKLQNGNSRMGHFSDEMKQILHNHSSLREMYPLKHVDYDESFMQLNSMPTRRRQGKSLRKSAEGSRWRRAKKPQVEWMVKQIKQVVEAHPDFGSRPLNVLDVGGGRGHLANHLASELGRNVANVHVIDIDNRAVKNGMNDAKHKDVEVTFGVGDASSGSNVSNLLQNGTDQHKSTFDIIIALHACGALSDVALGHAVVNKAAFVITPCCFRSNPDLMITLPSALAKDREISENPSAPGKNDTVRPSTWLGMEEDSLLALTQACEIQGDINIAGEAIHTLCALRANTVMKHFARHSSQNLNIRLKTFPIGFSTRNFCIIGKLT